MHLKLLSLHNFKNHQERKFEFSERLNCFAGNNGAGKTNLLDAIYYLSFCKSFFGLSDINNIKHNSDFFALHGIYKKDKNTEFKVSCIQQKGKNKVFKYDEKEYQKLSEHIGKIPLVMVSPYDNELINDGSEIRRKFVDNVICQLDKQYLEILVTYNKALLQRNTLLKKFAENNIFDYGLLSIWDEILITSGIKIHEKRKIFILEFVKQLKEYFKEISGSAEEVDMLYNSQLHENEFKNLLTKNIDKDRILKYTTTGIHKDDFEFIMNGMPIKRYGSQGQQKSYIIAIKLGQYKYIHEKLKIKPIILLDDIFAQLDNGRIERLTSLVCHDKFGQVFITDTHVGRMQNLTSVYGEDSKLFEI